MKWLVTTILTFISLVSVADVIDSIENVLKREDLTTSERIRALNYVSFDYAIVDPVKGIQYLNEAARLAQQIGDSTEYAESLVYLAYTYRITGNYERAISYSFKMLETVEHFDSPEQYQDFAYTVLGLAYDQLQDYDKSLQYHNMALRISSTPVARGHNLNNVGNVYINLEMLDSAYLYYHEARLIREQEQHLEGMSESYNNLGEVFRLKGQYDSALYYYDRSLEISEQLKDQNGITMTTMNIGAVKVKQGSWDQAEESLSTAYNNAKTLNFIDWEIESLTYLKELAEGRNDYQRALKYHEAYVSLKDSVFNIQKEQQIRLIETDYERLQQEKEVQLLRAENQLTATTRNFLIVGVIILVVVFVIVYNRQKLIFNTKQELAKAREDELRKELEYHSKSLSNHTLSMIQKNGMLEELKSEAKLLRDSLDDIHVRKLNSINRLIDHAINVDDDWKQFEMYFENVHNEFFTRLKSRYQGLTPSDMRLCALVKLNLNIKESATILGISPDSVKIARYRLRKKLNLESEENLADAIMV